MSVQAQALKQGQHYWSRKQKRVLEYYTPGRGRHIDTFRFVATDDRQYHLSPQEVNQALLTPIHPTLADFIANLQRVAQARMEGVCYEVPTCGLKCRQKVTNAPGSIMYGKDENG